MRLNIPKGLCGWLGNIVLLVLIYWAVQAYQGRETPDAGQAPPIDAIDINGQPVSLNDSKGEVTLIYFWATWCHVCSLTRNSINNIAQDYAVITIATQSGADDEVRKYLDKHAFNATTINDQSGQLSRAYGIRAFPTLFILNKNGEIDDVEIGLSSEWGLRFRLWKAGLDD